MARDKEPFLSRWSRRKLQEASAPAAPAAPAAPPEAAPPELPSVDQLGFDSDYRGFLHPKVDEALRRAALKKLFRSAHFSQPDMLDDFNQDYTLLENLAPGGAETLAHARRVISGGEPQAAGPEAAPAQVPPAAAPPEGPQPEAVAKSEQAPADPAKDDDGARG